METFTAYVDQYGYVVLFFALLLELIAIPMPGEVLMSYSGFLVYQGDLNWIISILLAGIGACIGMTISYWIGYKLGKPFFQKYGSRFHLGQDRIEKTAHWFNKHGNKFLIIAYFIPGVRHITGYFSGISELRFRTFAIFAYTGAFIWVSTFISLGKILGPQWEQFHNSIKKYLIIGGIFVAIILFIYYLSRKYKVQLKEKAIEILDFTIRIFHSRRRAGILLIITALLTAGLIILMVGMIQDFISNEFNDFNVVVNFLIPIIFNNNWKGIMYFSSYLGSTQFLMIIIILTVIWILWKGKDKGLELISLLIVVGGGELYEESIRRVFDKLSPLSHPFMNQILYAFPSEQSLLTFVVYGYSVFIFLKTINKIWVHTTVPFITLAILLFIAISRLYLEVQLPSDIAAGYVFGGVWLGLNIILLEVLRLLKGFSIQSSLG